MTIKIIQERYIWPFCKDINPLRGMEDLKLSNEFELWFANNITVNHDI